MEWVGYASVSKIGTDKFSQTQKEVLKFIFSSLENTVNRERGVCNHV